MYHRNQAITPTQQGVNGALDIFVEATLKECARDQLIGLAVVGSATEEQVNTATTYVHVSRGIPIEDIRSMLLT